MVAATQEEAAQTAATREERISNATRELEEKQEQSRRQAALVSKLVGEGENLRDEVRRCAAATQRLREAKDKVESKRSEGQRHSLEVEQVLFYPSFFRAGVRYRAKTQREDAIPSSSTCEELVPFKCTLRKRALVASRGGLLLM